MTTIAAIAENGIVYMGGDSASSNGVSCARFWTRSEFVLNRGSAGKWARSKALQKVTNKSCTPTGRSLTWTPSLSVAPITCPIFTPPPEKPPPNPDPPALREWVRRTPSVSQVFALGPDRKSLHPPAEGSRSESEKRFLEHVPCGS